MTLIIDRIESPQALAALEPEWAALDATTSPRLPFSSPRWTRLWFRHFAEDGALVHDRLSVRAVRTTGGELVGVAPLLITERPGVGPVHLRELHPIGSDPNVTEVRGAVCKPGFEEPFTRALIAQLLRERDEWDWLHLGGVREDGAAHHALSDAFVLEQSAAVLDYVLPLPATWEAFRAGLSRNMKEALRKCVNAPKRDGVELTFRVEAQAGASIERFFTLHRARADSTDRKQHRDVFQSTQARAFLHEYAAESAAAGELRVFELWSNERLVAVRVGFLLGRELYLYFSGEDPAFAKYSVLTRLVAASIEWAIVNGLALVNLSPGTDVSKTRWNPEAIPLLEVTAPAPSLLGPLARQLYRQVEALRANESLRNSPLVRLVRRHPASQP